MYVCMVNAYKNFKVYYSAYSCFTQKMPTIPLKCILASQMIYFRNFRLLHLQPDEK